MDVDKHTVSIYPFNRKDYMCKEYEVSIINGFYGRTENNNTISFDRSI